MYDPIVPPAAPTVVITNIRSTNRPPRDSSTFLKPKPLRLELSLSVFN